MDRAETDDYGSTTAAQPASELLNRREVHAAAFEATLKEVFLSQGLQLIEPLAKGSKETVVYGGRYHGEAVAVKIFVPAVDDFEDALSAFGSFKIECEKTMILSRRSPHILQVLEYGDAEIPRDLPEELREFFPVSLLPFMVTERARFGSLDRVMRHGRKAPGLDRTGLLEAVCAATDGIHEAHLHHVAHRDIKPQNILIFGPGSGKIADFGIARWRTRRVNRDTVMLTPKYASPEQAFYALTGEHEQNVDLRGDVYSWMIMVYELITGHHPFSWAIKAAAGRPAARAAQDHRRQRPPGLRRHRRHHLRFPGRQLHLRPQAPHRRHLAGQPRAAPVRAAHAPADGGGQAGWG